MVRVRLSGTAGPGLQHRLGVGVALVGQFLDVVEIVEHQQGRLQALRGGGAALVAGQQIDQRLDVEAAEHGAQQFRRLDLGDQRAAFLALRDLGQERRLDLGGIVHARGNPVGDQVHQELLLARRRVLKQADQLFGLLGGKRQGRNSERGTLSDMLAIGFKHG
jgi:hypothetical protein